MSKKDPKEFLSEIGEKTKNVFSQSPDDQSKDPSKGPLWQKIGVYALFILLFIAVVGLATFSVGIYGFKWDNRPAQIAKQIVPYPAAIVGFKAVSVYQVEKEAGHIEHFYQKSGATQGNVPNTEVVNNQVLDRLIEDQIISNLTRKYGVKVEKKEIDDQYAQIVKENGGEKKIESLLSDLYDLTVPEFKLLIEKQLQREKMQQKYEDELRLKAQARHILIKVAPKAKKADVNKARKQAQSILAKVNKKGANFANIAKKNSQDKATKNKGGQLPWFGKGDMVKEFEKAAFNLEPGDISKLVKTTYGFHIIQLEDKRGEVEENFTDWIDSLKKSWMVWKFIQW